MHLFVFQCCELSCFSTLCMHERHRFIVHTNKHIAANRQKGKTANRNIKTIYSYFIVFVHRWAFSTVAHCWKKVITVSEIQTRWMASQNFFITFLYIFFICVRENHIADKWFRFVHHLSVSVRRIALWMKYLFIYFLFICLLWENVCQSDVMHDLSSNLPGSIISWRISDDSVWWVIPHFYEHISSVWLTLRTSRLHERGNRFCLHTNRHQCSSIYSTIHQRWNCNRVCSYASMFSSYCVDHNDANIAKKKRIKRTFFSITRHYQAFTCLVYVLILMLFTLA